MNRKGQSDVGLDTRKADRPWLKKRTRQETRSRLEWKEPLQLRAQRVPPQLSAAGEGEYPFNEMVEGFPGSFWTAVSEGMIEEPELMGWNDRQAWRKTEGGLPKGVRDSTCKNEKSLSGGRR